ncbi:5-demethoxyubiquinol-8 5-hydroxylase UbiM [Paucibacter sp. DJ1R-11]|uniref:5-demethoxyubiquinol-8 5-hydroxylase UbiM n=1 Tax=Paucibacter sp. DJ1R-11 TaxID=2893556 RepID=UPI0021E3A72D|nr:5-demethoxyubiquinol-8 5-hydroxylase UbiM [Paucibacter sp. DJ1R-11]MCV2365275.1 5-demethoxyubiquinol-8 5-hydroxylase UbiM [Paucibacter sp. DJ1R-11]
MSIQPSPSSPPKDPAAHSDRVLIVGGGPAGLSMACALADAGISSCVLEAAPLSALQDPAEDGREIALTHPGRAVLEALGQWALLPPEEIAPLRRAHVFDGEAPEHLGFGTTDGQGELGYLVANHWLRRIAYRAVERRADRIELRTDCRVSGLNLNATPELAEVRLSTGESLRAPLVIAADSRFSTVRRMAGIGAQMRDFGRSVMVCRLAHSGPNEGIALECFHYGHTLALLPLNGGYSSLVLTVSADRAAEMQTWDAERFRAWVQTQLQGRLGEIRLASPRHLYPLVACYAHRFATRRLALVGDAAVGMHPVTAHGYNFGLYGVQKLANLLGTAHAQCQDLGDAALLQRYAAKHRRRTWAIYQGTNAVVNLFTDERAPARLLRKGVLQIARRLPPLQAAISAQLTGRTPPLISPLLRGLQALRMNRS